MENWIYASLPIISKVLVSLVAIFVVMILIVRISGLRTFAKMSSIDFASTIAVGSVLAAVIMNSGQSILKGAIALAGIIGFQTLFSFLVRKYNVIKKIATNDPLMLMRDGQILYDNLKSANVDIGSLMAKLREANVLDYSEVKAVILESTGDMSVLHGDSDKDIHPDILMGVRT